MLRLKEKNHPGHVRQPRTLETKNAPVPSYYIELPSLFQTRLVPGAFEKLCEALDWAGLAPDEGPNEGGVFGPYVQSKRLALYQEKIKVLLEVCDDLVRNF
jgi:hypothetical protein